MTDNSLEIFQLSVNYERTPVLWDISLQLPQGSLACIIGPNGAGKSTLIKTALGLIKPLDGSVHFFGKELKEVRARVGYVPQRESVDWSYPVSAHDLVLMGSYGRLGLGKFPSKKEKIHAMDMLKRVGMAEYHDRQISQLSGGQQQRIFLARALMQDCDLYLMDEPFAGIDFATAAVIWELLAKLKQEGKTIVVVHHDLSSVKEHFDFVIMLNMRLVACGPTHSTFTQEAVEKTFGKGHALFSEATQLAQAKQMGLS